MNQKNEAYKNYVIIIYNDSVIIIYIILFPFLCIIYINWFI